MESSAEVEVGSDRLRHDLIYGTYIGDGDSSSYKNLVKSNPYDGVAKVRKKECLGHVQKRIAKADIIADLYALVISQHKGERAQDIQEALQILLRHTEEEHDTCPGGTSSWCQGWGQIQMYIVFILNTFSMYLRCN